MTQAPALPLFEENAVSVSRVKIVNAGDGLSEALKVDPVALFLDDEVYYVLQGKVTSVAHVVDKDGITSRVHTIKADGIAPIDQETARKAIQTAAEETERIRAEQAGQLALGAEQAALEKEAKD